MKPTFSIAHLDPEMINLVDITDQRTLAIWSKECAERVLPFFEDNYPTDPRPREALRTLREWIDTGKFSMSVIRTASLDSHAAARDVGADTPARSAARAAGQAVATAHVPRHAYGSAIYAQQAVFRDSPIEKAESAAYSERDWQYMRLLELNK